MQLRFQDAHWMKERETRIATIIGAGSVGSMLAFYLSKQMKKLFIYDGDTIEAHNQGTQLYASNQVGEAKVFALNDILKAFSDINTDIDHTIIRTVNEYWKPGSFLGNVVFSCVDSIKVRKELFDQWCRSENKEYFIDMRMNAEYGQLFVVTNNEDRIKAYRQSMEGEFPEQVCTYQMTIQCAAIMAGFAVQAYNNLRSKIPAPFETYFNGPLLQVTNSNEHADAYRQPTTNRDDGVSEHDTNKDSQIHSATDKISL